MELVDVKNNLLINKLVKNHFSLDKKSQKLFTERLLYERPIAKEFEMILKAQSSKDLRARFDLDINFLETIDSTWAEFKDHFNDYVKKRGIKYKDYINNKITINKNEVKIVKDLVSFFKEEVNSFFNNGFEYNTNFLFNRNDVAKTKIYTTFLRILKSYLTLEPSFIASMGNIPEGDIERGFFITDKSFDKDLFDKDFNDVKSFFNIDYNYYNNYFINSKDYAEMIRVLVLFTEENYEKLSLICFSQKRKLTYFKLSDFISKEHIKIIKKEFKIDINAQVEQKVRYIYSNITQSKFFKGQELELVISLNYADWFLASTGDSWSSCISLYSDYEECFWTGLPQLIGDKSRAMMYITEKNGSKKSYNGIEVDKFIGRSWIQLWRYKKTNETFFSLTKMYPMNISEKILNTLENIFQLKKINYGDSYEENMIVSRYYSENLWFFNSMLTTIYLDQGSYKIAQKNKAKYFLGDYGYYSFAGNNGSYRYFKDSKQIIKEHDFLNTGVSFNFILEEGSTVKAFWEKEFYEDDYQDDYQDDYEDDYEDEAY